MAVDNKMKNKTLVWDFHKRMAASDALSASNVIKDFVDENVLWHGPHPINNLKGQPALFMEFWKPFFEAFPVFERHHDIFLDNAYKGSNWVSSMGHYVAKFEKNWLGIPANGKLVSLRFGEFCRVNDGKIQEMYVLFDLLDLMRQVDLWPLKKSLGSEAWWPKPASYNGILTTEQEATETRKTLKLIANWTDEIKHFDQTVANLDLLNHADYFSPKCFRYASSGIGATFGIEDFKQSYQAPFIHAFTERKFGNHQVRIADGPYMAASGWENIKGRHIGELLGVAPSNAQVKIRAMEWWRRDGERIKESWLMIDMVDLLLQLGEDEFEKMREAQAKDQWI